MAERSPAGESEAHGTGGTPGRGTERGPDRTTSLDVVRDVYADQADRMARFDWANRLFTGRYRKRLFGRAGGRVLDVACGTGLNRQYLPDGVEYVGVDLSRAMLANAADRFAESGVDGQLVEMDAQALAFADDSFDAVVSSLSTCTFPDPVAALREMGRVCAPDGRILLLEHGRSSVGPVARVQDWRADAHFEKHACRLNQEPLANVTHAGLSVLDADRTMLGIVTAVEATPD